MFANDEHSSLPWHGVIWRREKFYNVDWPQDDIFLDVHDFLKSFPYIYWKKRHSDTPARYRK